MVTMVSCRVIRKNTADEARVPRVGMHGRRRISTGARSAAARRARHVTGRGMLWRGHQIYCGGVGIVFALVLVNACRAALLELEAAGWNWQTDGRAVRP